jgi:hypothetical protein
MKYVLVLLFVIRKFSFEYNILWLYKKESLRIFVHTVKVGPCHHGMARLRVADGRAASNMEGSCDYIE